MDAPGADGSPRGNAGLASADRSPVRVPVVLRAVLIDKPHDRASAADRVVRVVEGGEKAVADRLDLAGKGQAKPVSPTAQTPLRIADLLCSMHMRTPEDVTEIERAGRRCAICHSGRRWRQFEVARPEGQKPVVMCAACRVRYGAAPPLPATQKAAAPTVVTTEAAAPKQRTAPREDRLRKALRQLPRKPHSVGQVAKAAGLNHDKTLNRLRALQAAGEVQQVGQRWSSQPPSTDLDAAFDRLQAQTNNLRIIRDRDPVG